MREPSAKRNRLQRKTRCVNFNPTGGWLNKRYVRLENLAEIVGNIKSNPICPTRDQLPNLPARCQRDRPPLAVTPSGEDQTDVLTRINATAGAICSPSLSFEHHY